MTRRADKGRALLLAAFLFHAVPASAAYVDSLYGPPTAAEVAATAAWFRANPYNPGGNNQGNNYAYGTGAQRAGRMSTLYSMTRDLYFLDQMIRFSDHILSVRNDNGERRVLWTGNIEPAWPNKAATARDAAYSGTENGYVLGHMMAPAVAIAQRPEIWNVDVGIGDPHGYGRTYIERARRFLFEANRTYDEFILPYFVDPTTLRLRMPTHPGWAAMPGNYAKDQGHGVPWNQQDMVTSGLRSTANMLMTLGEDPDRVERYDAITRASMAWFMSDLDRFRYEKNGYNVYLWGYPPGGAERYPEDLGHASADINHLYSCYKLGRFGVTRNYLEGVGNTFMEVVRLPNGTFAGNLKGGGTPRTSVSTSWAKYAQFRAGIYEVQFQEDELLAAQTNAEAALGILAIRRDLFDGGEVPTPGPTMTPGTPTPPPTPTPTPTPDPDLGPNLALGKAASASTNWSASYDAPKAFDGLEGTRWSASAASATNQWIAIDFGAPTTYNCVVIKEINYKRVTSHVLQRSDDGTTYEDIPGTTGTTIGARKTVCFDTLTAHHLRLFMHEAKQSNALKEPTINEVAVYYEQRPPVVTVPEDMVAEATGPDGAVVTFEVSATDDKDRDTVATASPASGSVFPLGSTTVSATATDSDGNTGQAEFAILVVDTTPPVLNVPAATVAEATSAAGAVVHFAASAQDLVSGTVEVTYDFPPGGTFSLGRTIVTATATDAAENTATGIFTIDVVDTRPPTLTLPPSMVLEATSAAGAMATFTATAEDVVSGNVPVVFSIPSGSTFPIGATTVTAVATDAAGNTATGELTITVRDTTAPVISAAAASPNRLWPPNHRLVTVQVPYQVADPVGVAETKLTVVSDQPQGWLKPDWIVVDTHTVKLRAERSFWEALFWRRGRTYTITIEARDAANNVSTAKVEVVVPAWNHQHRVIGCRHDDHLHDGDDD